MKQRLTNMIIAFALLLSGSTMLVPAVAFADFKGDACEGVNTLNGSGGSTCDAAASTKLDNAIEGFINILSVIVGFAAVIMIIIGGFKFITAGGDSGAVASARSTIIYALIGLVIVALAQVIVHYVIRKAT